MAGTVKLIASVAHLPAAVANIYTPNASADIATIINHIHVANKTGAAATFTLFVGASGVGVAGTEIALAKNVPANDYVDMFFSPGMKLSSTQFLTGLASAATTLTITVMGQQIVI